MIRSIHVDGYKGLRDVRLSLNTTGPTVLLGPNGAGKSSVFGALRLVHELAWTGIEKSQLEGKGFETLVHRRDSMGHVALQVEMERPENLVWRVEVRGSGGSPHVASERLEQGGQSFDRPPPGEPWAFSDNGVFANARTTETLCSVARQAEPPQGKARWWFEQARAVAAAVGPVRLAELNPSRIAAPAQADAPVEPDGYGLPSALLALQNARRKSFLSIDERFRQMLPWIEEVQVPPKTPDPKGPSYVHLNFLERGASQPYAASDMASGMLLALALLWIVLRPEGDRILCFEEPENSMHPYLLGEVYELLSMAARGEIGGQPVQVLVATHSVDFVNLCKPEEVRVCERDEGGAVHISEVGDDPQLRTVIKKYKGALGELWYSGAIRGVPGRRQGSRSG